jgi:hypothetical protein
LIGMSDDRRSEAKRNEKRELALAGVLLALLALTLI